MEEIDRCRPHFIGLLGDRYGWIPEEIPPEVIQSEPQLFSAEHASITELEILHAALNSPQTAKHALFYFRDPDYIAKLPEAERSAYRSESPEAAEKLRGLKERIIAAGLPVREHYPNPKACGEMILRDLKKVIEESFPSSSADEPLEREATAHEVYAKSRAQVYVSRAEAYQRLDRHAESTDAPLVVLGEPGSGKSALLANWSERYHRKNPHVPVIMHFVGASASSADWSAMVRRLIGELNRHLNIAHEIPNDPALLRSAFASCLHGPAKGRIVLVLDGLNQLEDREGALDLTWLPETIPEHVRILVSTLPGRPLEALQQRGCPTWTIFPLTVDERKQLIRSHLQLYRKSLPQLQMEDLASAPQCGNPLYLRALLEELRVFGLHERIRERLDHYLAAQTIPDLYSKILERYETDYDRERPGIVQETMLLLLAARLGLAEAEILDMLGSNGMPLPRAYWSPLFLAVENSLINRSGLLGFSHAYLREAVRRRYLRDEASQRQIHLKVAHYFLPRDLSQRKMDELPWQLIKATAWEELYTLVADPEFYSAFYRHNKPDALRAWSAIEEESEHRIIDAYSSVLRHPSDYANDVLEVIANLLDVTGHWPELMPLRRTLAEHYARTNDTSRLAANLLGQASILVTQGNLDEALSILDEQGSLVWRTQEPWILQEFLRVKSMALWQKGVLHEAMELLKIREELCRGIAGFEHQLAGTLAHQSFIMQLRGEHGAAERVLRKAERISRESGDLNGYQAVLGEFGLILLKLGDMDGAMAKFSEQERICRELGDLSSLAGCLGNQGAIYTGLGRRVKALAAYEEMESVAKKIEHRTLYHVSRSNQAAELYRTNETKRAQAMNDEAIAFFRANGLIERLATSLFLRGHIFSFMLDPAQADRTYAEALGLFEQFSPPRDLADLMCKAGRHYLAVFDMFHGPSQAVSISDDFERRRQRALRVGEYLDRAEKHLRKALDMCPDCADGHQCLAEVLLRRGDIDGAIASFRCALEIRPDWTEVLFQLTDLLMNKETTP